MDTIDERYPAERVNLVLTAGDALVVLDALTLYTALVLRPGVTTAAAQLLAALQVETGRSLIPDHAERAGRLRVQLIDWWRGIRAASKDRAGPDDVRPGAPDPAP